MRRYRAEALAYIKEINNMTNPAHEWREELEKKFDGSNIFWKVILKHLTPETIAFIKKDYEVTIQTLLTTHTAHLVERLESLRPTEVQKVMGDLNGTEAKYQLFDHALDQAIDIIKDNK